MDGWMRTQTFTSKHVVVYMCLHTCMHKYRCANLIAKLAMTQQCRNPSKYHDWNQLDTEFPRELWPPAGDIYLYVCVSLYLYLYIHIHRYRYRYVDINIFVGIYISMYRRIHELWPSNSDSMYHAIDHVIAINVLGCVRPPSFLLARARACTHTHRHTHIHRCA